MQQISRRVVQHVLLFEEILNHVYVESPLRKVADDIRLRLIGHELSSDGKGDAFDFSSSSSVRSDGLVLLVERNQYTHQFFNHFLPLLFTLVDVQP